MGIAEFLITVVIIGVIAGGIFLYRKQLAKKAPAGIAQGTSSPRFCPKCGDAIPEGASACEKCGAEIDRPAAVPAALAALGGIQLPKLGKVAIVCIGLAIVLSLFPWFQSGSVASYTKGVSNLLGGMGSSMVFEPSYWLWNGFSLAGTLGNYFSLMGNSTATGSLTIAGPLSIIALIAAVALIAYGVYTALRSGNMLGLRIGALCMLVAECSFFVIGVCGSDIGSMSPLFAIAMILTVVAAIVAFAVPSSKA